MCIITGPVRAVNSTKIFVAPSRSRNRQLTVYSNVVDTAAQNLMVLPVPNPETVEFEEGIMYYKNLFRDAEASFYNPYEPATLSVRSTREGATLRVHDVGSYQASIAKSISDLSRLDTNIFQMPAELIDMLTKTYGKASFGFICCVLKAGGNKYEPLAYTHQRLSSRQLFVPTKHYHPSKGTPLQPPSGPYRDVWAALVTPDPNFVDDWDHEVYSIGTTVESAHRPGYLPTEKNQMDWGKFPPEYQYTPAHRMCRWGLKGRWANQDLMFDMVAN